MLTKQKRRPALTATAIAGLRAVWADAYMMVSDREGNNDDSMLERDAQVWRGLAYIDALCDWYDAKEEAQAFAPATVQEK
jgi:hypothetical protein